MAEEVVWLLEELSQYDGSELLAAVTAARGALGQQKHEEGRKQLKRRRSLIDTATSHPVKEGVKRFASLVETTEHSEVGHHGPEMPTIEDLRERLLEDDDQQEEQDSDQQKEEATNTEGGFSEVSTFFDAQHHFDGATETRIDDLDDAASVLITASLATTLTLKGGGGGPKDKEELHLLGDFAEAARKEALAAQHAVDLLWAPTDEGSALTRGSLVKTIRNDQWVAHFVFHLRKTLRPGSHARQFYTPCSLPPRGCVGMRLFGRVWAQSCGVVFDRSALNLPADVWAWRSGFFAKTEFGVTSRTTADKNLRPDLAHALASLEELEDMAAKKEYEHFGERKIADDSVVPYNEVFAAVKPDAVVAVFSRTTQVRHLLLAMAARDAIQRLVPQKMGILVIDAGGLSPPKIVSLGAQAALLKRVAESTAECEDQVAIGLPDSAALGLDLTPYLRSPESPISSQDALLIHAAVGLDAVSIKTAIFDVARKEANDGDNFLPIVERHCEATLRRAVVRRNAKAADAIVRVFATALLDEESSSQALAAASPFVVPANVDDDDCLRAAGAFACLRATASGRLPTAARQVVDLLNHWLDKAETSLAFRVKAWRDASKHPVDAAPSFAAFAGKKAVTNRTNFRDKVLPLLQYNDHWDPFGALSHLTNLVDSVSKPTLRLELLLFITGLDFRWSRDLLLHSCELAREALNAASENKSGKQPASPTLLF